MSKLADAICLDETTRQEIDDINYTSQAMLEEVEALSRRQQPITAEEQALLVKMSADLKARLEKVEKVKKEKLAAALASFPSS